MKHLLIILYFIFISTAIYATKVKCLDAYNIKSVKNCTIFSDAIDADGCHYIYGSFMDNLVIDTFTIVSNGDQDGFLCKLDTNKKVVWIKTIGGKSSNFFFSMILNSSNIYLTVTIKDSISINGFPTFFTSPFNSGSLIFNFDINGNFKWIKQLYDEFGFYHSLSTLNNQLLVSTTRYETILDTNNNIIQKDSFKRASGFSNFVGNNNVYLLSKTNGVLLPSFRDTMAQGFLGNSLFSTALCISRHDANMHPKWLRTISGVGLHSPYLNSFKSSAITADRFGNVIVCGSRDGGIIKFHDGSSFAEYTGPGFIAKYDSFGNLLWKKNNEARELNDITTDSLGNIYCLGAILGGTFGLDTFTFPDRGIFVCKYSPNGDELMAYLSLKSNGIGYHMRLVEPDVLDIAGFIATDSCQFGDSTLYSSASHWDGFYARLQLIGAPLNTANLTLQEPTTIYPNPANAVLMIDTKNVFNTIEILDVQGKIILQSHPNQTTKIQIPIANINNGMYILRLKNNTSTIQQKIIIQH